MANFDEVVAAAWNKKVGKLSDAVFNATPLFSALGKDGFTEKIDGGAQIEMSLEVSENPNVGFIAPAGVIPTDDAQTFDAATYSPKLQAGAVIIKWTDELKVAGDSAKFPWVQGKLENQRKTAIRALNRALYGDGSAADSMDGLAKLISATPSTGTVGNIPADTYAFWRNQQASGAHSITAFDNLRAAMRTVYNNCEEGDPANAPTHGLTDKVSFGGYEAILIAVERYNKEGSKQQGGNAGFDNFGLQFKASKIIYDPDCSAGDLFFINNKFLKLVVYSGAFLKMKDKVPSVNQFVDVYKIGTYGQLCTNNRRRLGRVTTID